MSSPAPACSHRDSIDFGVTPSNSEACECRRIGSGWVHLREWVSSGEVRRCDDAPRRHAAKYREASGHLVICSLEHSEDRFWCYEDRVMFELEES